MYGSVRSVFRGRDTPTAQQLNGEMNGGFYANDLVYFHLTLSIASASEPLRPLPSEPPVLPPLTPLDIQRVSGGGSMRSILKDKNTPGTGQNVRFFSRDAYRVISPESSVDNSISEPPQAALRGT